MEAIASAGDESKAGTERGGNINAAVFEEIFEAHYKRVLNFCAYRISDRHEAEDLVSQVFEKVIANYGAYRPMDVPLEAWIITIARNVVNDYFRQKKKLSCVPLDLANDTACAKNQWPEETLMANERKAALMRALDALSEKERTVVAMKFAGELKNVDIAQAMSLSESNVGIILHRSLKKMRPFF